jgi:hypothetical protein
MSNKKTIFFMKKSELPVNMHSPLYKTFVLTGI